jgi:hypothetical protein
MNAELRQKSRSAIQLQRMIAKRIGQENCVFCEMQIRRFDIAEGAEFARGNQARISVITLP